MPRLKKTKSVIVNDHVEGDTGHYINMRKWLSRIYKVVDVHRYDDKGKNLTWTVDGDCKMIYAYLSNWAKAEGFRNVYPNYTMICEELGVHERTLTRKLNILSEVGLLKIVKNKSKDGRFDSNQYYCNTPQVIANKKWYDVNGVQLMGKLYQFDFKVFKNRVRPYEKGTE